MQAAMNVASMNVSETVSSGAASQDRVGQVQGQKPGREFSEVLRETEVNPQTTKEKSAADGTRDGSQRSAGSPEEAQETSRGDPPEAAQGTVEQTRVQEVASEDSLGAEDLEAAISPPATGNVLPPWVQALLVPGTAPVAAAVSKQEAAATVESMSLTITPDADAVPTAMNLNPLMQETPEPQNATDGARVQPNAAQLAVTVAKASSGATAGGSDSSLPQNGQATADQSGARNIETMLTTAANAVAAATGPDATAQPSARAEAAVTMPLSAPSASMNAGLTPTTTAGAASTATLPLPLQHPQWQEAFAARIAWQARDGLQQVSLAINPAELGPVEVRMSVSDGQVNAQFLTAHHSVRQVIEDAMPRLRDMLSQSGLNLADASVFQQAPGRDGRASNPDSPWSEGADERMSTGDSETTVRSARVRGIGLIDAYV